MTNHTEPFVFYTEQRLVALTALTAGNLQQLLKHLRDVSGSSIFYHTHHMYLAHHFDTPVFSNDFALWASEVLQEEALGEKLAAIDLLSFTSIRKLREAVIATIEQDISENGGRMRECPSDDEFRFCRSKSFIMPTGLIAHNPRELRPWRYLNVSPSEKALKKEREKLHEMTNHWQCFKPIPLLIEGLNRHLKGWKNYFDFGYPRQASRDINLHVRDRLTQHLRRRSQRPFRPPEGVSFYGQIEHFGLVRL